MNYYTFITTKTTTQIPFKNIVTSELRYLGQSETGELERERAARGNPAAAAPSFAPNRQFAH